VLITGDLGFSVLDEFAESCPNQFINAGVAEQIMTMLACGMALEGAKVFTYSIANFTILRCLEQLRNDVCYHDADVTAVSVGGGFSYGQLGMSHFATEDLAIMRALPNMTVVAPTDPWEASVLTNRIVDRGGPCYFRLDKGESGLAPGDEEKIQIGRARIVMEGSDLTIIATGAVLREALDGAGKLKKQGISTRVIAMHTIKPLDIDAVCESFKVSRLIITLEEHNIIGGLGGAVAEVIADSGAQVVLKRIGLNDIYPTVVGDQKYLRQEYCIDSAAVLRCVEEAFKGKKNAHK
jgi:transketolase